MKTERAAVGSSLHTARVDRRMRELIERQETQRGLLIAFEGPAGSGKTTQRKLFTRWLESLGHRVVTSKWSSSPLIRPLIKARKKRRAASAQELSLLEAADFQHRLQHEILPALWAGKMVVADRYFFTALARHAARGLELDWLLRAYVPLFWPDTVFYFAVSVETSTKRIVSNLTASPYPADAEDKDVPDAIKSYRRFITRNIREYESLAMIFQFVTIDAERPIYEQHRDLRKLFEPGRRRPWADRNIEALTEWLRTQPDALTKRDHES